MRDLKIGDIVARRSYGQDVFFKVVCIKEIEGERIVTLKGISYRIEADAPESDLVVQPMEAVDEYYRKCFMPPSTEEVAMSGIGVKYTSGSSLKKSPGKIL